MGVARNVPLWGSLRMRMRPVLRMRITASASSLFSFLFGSAWHVRTPWLVCWQTGGA
jgi:hypothetical protein